MSLLSIALFPGAVTACTPEREDDFSAGDDADIESVTWGEAVVCEDPVDGFVRLEEVGEEHGLDVALQENPWSSLAVAGGTVIARDLDADGDVDLAFGELTGLPLLMENDGRGYFEQVAHDWRVAAAGWQRFFVGVGSVDIDQDGLPDLLMVGPGLLAASRNLGAMRFEDPVALWEEGFPTGIRASWNAGDFDGDGDLDLVLPGLDEVSDLEDLDFDDTAGSPDLVLLQEDGVFEVALELPSSGEPGLSLIAAFTDRDEDGDRDLLVLSDRGGVDGHPASAFYRNDGGALTNDAAAIGAEVAVAAMGLATGDFNQDGALDYCWSDEGPIGCLFSDGAGGFADATATVGLSADHSAEPAWWTAWALDVVDLDNDGHRDVMSVAGEHPEPAVEGDHVDGLWEGTDSGWVNRSAAAGFDDPADHYGAAVADLDGDGYVEIVVAGPAERPKLWKGPCGPGHWVEVELSGVAPNREAWGARVELTWEGGQHTEELQNLRLFGQGPHALHVGLGNADTVSTLEVLWPDGAATSAASLPVDRRLVVHHPDGG